MLLEICHVIISRVPLHPRNNNLYIFCIACTMPVYINDCLFDWFIHIVPLSYHFYISHCSRVAVSWSNVCALLWERTSLIWALTA